MKKADCEPLGSIRELIKFINEGGIQKDDIVTIISQSGQFLLIYYK